MADKLEKLRRKRGNVKAQATQVMKAIESELMATVTDTEHLSVLIRQLSKKEEILLKLNDEVFNEITDVKELDKEDQLTGDYHDALTEWAEKATYRISQMGAGGQTAASNTPTGSVNSLNLGGNINQGQATVKLPKYVIKNFKGDITLWRTFWSQYSNAVHDNPDMPKVAKFTYLKSYLEGLAAQAIAGLAVTDENYDEAIDILVKRFGNTEAITHTHIRKLMSIPEVKRSTDTTGLRELHDACEVEVRSLKALNLDTDDYSKFLCPVILGRLPHELSLEFTRTTKQEDWKVSELLQFLCQEVRSRERMSAINSVEPSSASGSRTSEDREITRQHYNGAKNYGNTSRKRPVSASALGVGAEPVTCVFCKTADHESEGCQSLSVKEKRDVIHREGRCFLCTKPYHNARVCRSRNKLSCKHCGRKHHSALCESESKTLVQGKTMEDKEHTKKDQGTSAILTATAITPSPSGKTILLQTAQVHVSNGGSSTKRVRCIMDSGSHRTFICEDLSRELELHEIGYENLDIFAFNNANPERVRQRRVKVILENPMVLGKKIEIEALETKSICSAMISVPGEEVTKTLRQRGLQIADDQQDPEAVKGPPGILLGSDYYWTVVIGKTVRLGASLVALETKFGWALQGPTNVSSLSIGVNMIATNTNPDMEKEIAETIKAFWSLDSMGITENQGRSATDQETLEEFRKSITYKDNRYEVALPWTEDKHALGSNYNLARCRTENLRKRFCKDPFLFAQFREVIQEQERLGIIEEVPELEEDYGNPKYYLPYHGVFRSQATTTKLRIVNDASSHENGVPSLNDCLRQGPNLNPEVLDVLIRFRTHTIAFTSDIEKAFLQISLKPADRDCVRFLWCNDPNPTEKLKTYRITRVPFGVKSSPFLLSATIGYHLDQHKEEHEDICARLRRDIYVDDFVSGGDGRAQVETIYHDSNAILKSAGMKLRKWRTNDMELQTQWNHEQDIHDDSKRIQCKDTISHEKVLGLIWNSETDSWVFDLTSLLPYLANCTTTKRSVLQAVARIFDPIGFLTPFIITVKMLFQRIWELGLNWDDALPEALANQFEQWRDELPSLNLISISRHYFGGHPETELDKVDLHIFCDASEKAYATVAYVRYTTTEGKIGVSLVASKSKVAPLKRLTLPRLELMGAILAARLVTYLKPNFLKKLNDIRLWTDSSIALHWIKGSAVQWKPFISNRVTEVQSLTEPRMWGHVRGRENPADLPTRGANIDTLASSSIWWHGPDWLRQEEKLWPKPTVETPCNITIKTEKRTKYQDVAQGSCIVSPRETLLDLKTCSSYRRILRISAWVWRFVTNCRKAKTDRIQGALSAEELNKAEMTWVQQAQSEDFGKEIQLLKNGQSLQENSKIRDLNPLLDENGLICVGGRLDKGAFTYREKHPWVLSKDNHLTKLLVMHYHERNGHAGLSLTISDIRERFWIPRGRQEVKSIIKRCVFCKQFNVQAGQMQAAPLPADRITETPPFETSGVDFAGPLYVRNGKKLEKTYITLFTCAVTRALHLELVTNLSTEKFLLAFSRFIARRGIPKIMYSDNARTFKRADRDVQELWQKLRSPEVKEFIGNKGITWKYITERAAWHGGFWERLVRTTKGCLKRILGRATLGYEELETTLMEVEAIVNSRPISFVYNEPGEPSPLTPGHFLIGQRLMALPSRTFPISEPIPTTRQHLMKRLRYRQNLLDRYWARWKSEYLFELRSAHHVNQPKRETILKIGDVVLVHEDKTPRLSWKMGVIEETFKGRDNNIRSCMVRVNGGQRLRRPLQLLYPLEIN